jgi:carboxyl-terminal processing protease
MTTNRRSKDFLIPLGFAIALIIGLWIGRGLAPQQNAFGLTPGEEKYSKVKDIIEILNNKYVDSLNADQVFENAIADMLHKLDPHSNYIPATELKAATEMIQGKFGGVGVRFTIIRDTICITHVIKNSPSDRVGIKAGDKIIEVDKQKVASKKITNDKVMQLLKGQENTTVQVKLVREGKLINKTITRGTIPIESITSAYMLTSTVGYIRLDQFSVSSAFEFEKAARMLKAKGMKKLIFDLRSNGGGVLQTATEIVDQFLDKNKIIVETRGLHSKRQIYKTSDKGFLKDLELAVLINSGSASASEIVAGALQDNDRATIVGRRSFGKGLVQEDILLKDGSNLRLTIARYYTPTGRCIQKPYSDDYEKYMMDQFDRNDNGELYKIDSTLLVDSLKFKTPKGKIVYGGGGILPDVFVPADTSGSSWYYTELRYIGAFSQFAFDFVSTRRNQWASIEEFNLKFEVSDDILNSFVRYAEKELKIKQNPNNLKQSKKLITQSIKAEIARQIWVENGYFYIMNQMDSEVQKALKILTTK